MRKFYNFYTIQVSKICNVSLHHDIFGAMHRYFQILYRPISTLDFGHPQNLHVSKLCRYVSTAICVKTSRYVHRYCTRKNFEGKSLVNHTNEANGVGKFGESAGRPSVVSLYPNTLVRKNLANFAAFVNFAKNFHVR